MCVEKYARKRDCVCAKRKSEPTISEVSIRNLGGILTLLALRVVSNPKTKVNTLAKKNSEH